jgi:hypothetical protein
VAAKRDNPSLRSDEITYIGLSQLLGKRDQKWRQGPVCMDLAKHLLDSRHLPFVLAARAMRNSIMHREGVDHGAIEWDPRHIAPIQGLSGFWLFADSFRPVALSDGRSIDLYGPFAQIAPLSDPEHAVLTFLQVVDGIWDHTSRLVSDGLRGLSWGGLDWARQTWGEAVKKGDVRPWRTRHQRRLWGLTTTR